MLWSQYLLTLGTKDVNICIKLSRGEGFGN